MVRVDIPAGATDGGVNILLIEISLGTRTARSAEISSGIVLFSLFEISDGTITFV
jgi:hypothetical protein